MNLVLVRLDIWVEMEGRTFNSVMSQVNSKWAAQVLNMEVNPSKGPDLIDSKKIVELKFTLNNPDKYKHLSWRVLEYQMTYPEDRGLVGFWGLAIYELDRNVGEIETKDKNELEEMVVKRELFLVPWEWMNQFPAYNQKGKTQISIWDNTLRFPKKSKLPAIVGTHEVKKGLVHFTEGVDSEYFEMN